VRAAAKAHFFCVLALAGFLAGCATSDQRGHYLQQVDPASLTNLVAYRLGTNLDIRIPLRGKDAFVHGTWPAAAVVGGTNYQHRFTMLTFDKEEPVGHWWVVTRKHRLAVHNARQWQQLVQQVFAELVPAQSGHGVLLLVQNEDLILFRDQAGRFRAIPLENKPPEIVVDRTYNDTDFSRLTIGLLEAYMDALDSSQSQFLFVTGEDPAFVLVDLQQRLIVFLYYPVDPDTPQAPSWFAVRALNSLFIKSLVITAIKNPFTLVSRGLWHLGNSGAAAFAPGPESSSTPPPPLATGPGMDLAAWDKELDRLLADRPFKGKIDFLINGDQFFPAFIQSLQAATNSIDMSVFIFDSDDYAVKIADLLKKRSADARVRLLMDDLGSLFAAQSPAHSPSPRGFQAPDDIAAYLESGSKVHVRMTLNPWLTIDHRKYIVIDGREAYLGGMNIGREYRYDWHDMMVGLKGPIVGYLEKEYRKAWAHASLLGDLAYAWVSLFDHENPRKRETPGAIEIRALRTATGRTEIFRAQLAAIDRARSYIYIENAYFNDASIIRGLVAARRRGVDVRVVLAGKNDSGVMQTSSLMAANDLMRNGIRVYIYPGMTHIKAAIYDGWACIGSANFEKLSLRIGQELDIGFSDPATVERLRTNLFDADFARSRELTAPVPLNWFDPLVRMLGNQL
jgi:cardiolipin synthase A/B